MTQSPPETNETAPFGTFHPDARLERLLAITQSCGRGWLSQRVAFALRALGVSMLKGRPADVERMGARFRLYPGRNVCEKRILFTPDYFDAAERAFLASRIVPGFVFLDVGANVGGYSMAMAALAGSGAHILAVEPQPKIFERLAFNIRQNPFGTVKALDCAVADRNGEVTLFIDPSNQGESSVKLVGSTDQAQLKVPARTLLDLVTQENFDHVDALKIDVEGAEDLILEPFFREAPEALWPKAILMENSVGVWQIDLPKLLADKGYRPAAMMRRNLAYVRD
jgi:FkbM family methyltransferase